MYGGLLVPAKALWNFGQQVQDMEPTNIPLAQRGPRPTSQLSCTGECWTLPIILTDANARLGTTVLHALDGLMLIGPHSHQQENGAGRSFRGFLERTQLAALNTIIGTARGATWYDTRGHSGCIDYVISRPGACSITHSLQVLRRLGHLLQLSHSELLADHVPIKWRFEAPSNVPPYRSHTMWNRPQIDHLLANSQYQQNLCKAIESWASDSDTKRTIDDIERTRDVDAFHDIIYDKIFAHFDVSLPAQACRRFPAENPEVAIVLDRKWALKQQLHEADQHSLFQFLKHQLYLVNEIIRRKRNDSWRQRQQALSTSLIQHSRRHHWRQAWQTARAIAQPGIGPRNRPYHNPTPYSPTVSEWCSAMKKVGSEAGCLARTIWNSYLPDVGQFFRLKQLALISSDVDLQRQDAQLVQDLPSDVSSLVLGEEDFEATSEQLKRKSGFAVPPWACPREVWQILFRNQTQEFRSIMTRFFALIRKTGKIPLFWSISLGFGIPKYNGKSGTSALRLLHLLDPLSKAWVSGIWRKVEYKLSPTSFGCISGKEQKRLSLSVLYSIAC